MTNTIGIRIYRIDIAKRGNRKRVAFESPPLSIQPQKFIESFIDRHSGTTRDDKIERTWYFEKLEAEKNNIRGYIRYGTFGFESNLVDARTKRKNYKRKTTDVEEIPLFFEFWFPPKADFALVAFQSFQTRSCIGLIISRIREVFEKSDREYILRFYKLAPHDLRGLFSKAPVKRIRFIQRNTSSDMADLYVGKGEIVDREVMISAIRRRDLGSLGSFFKKLPSAGVIEFDGEEYDAAVAEVRFGNRLRRVGVFGLNRDAGAIDLTDSIQKGDDGHPTFDSLKRETKSLLGDFYAALKRPQ